MVHNRRIIKLDGKVVAHVPVLARDVISGIDRFTVGLISATLTHPDYRRRGLATRCLMDAVRIMDERGLPVSALWTVKPTFPFYQNSGWEAVSSQGHVYRVRNSEAHLFRTAPSTWSPTTPRTANTGMPSRRSTTPSHNASGGLTSSTTCCSRYH